MDALFLFLFLLSGVLFWFGIIYPRILWLVVRFKLTRPKAALLLSLTSILFFIGFVATADFSTTKGEASDIRNGKKPSENVEHKLLPQSDTKSDAINEARGMKEFGLGISKDSIIQLVNAIDASYKFSDNLDSDTTAGISDDGSIIILGPRNAPTEILVFVLIRGHDVRDLRSLLLLGTLPLMIDTNTGFWTGEFFENAPANTTVRDSAYIGGRKYKLVSAMDVLMPNVTLSVTSSIRNTNKPSRNVEDKAPPKSVAKSNTIIEPTEEKETGIGISQDSLVQVLQAIYPEQQSLGNPGDDEILFVLGRTLTSIAGPRENVSRAEFQITLVEEDQQNTYSFIDMFMFTRALDSVAAHWVIESIKRCQDRVRFVDSITSEDRVYAFDYRPDLFPNIILRISGVPKQSTSVGTQ